MYLGVHTQRINSYLTHYGIIILRVEEKKKSSITFSDLCFEERQMILLYMEMLTFCFHFQQQLKSAGLDYLHAAVKKTNNKQQQKTWLKISLVH